MTLVETLAEILGADASVRLEGVYDEGRMVTVTLPSGTRRSFSVDDDQWTTGTMHILNWVRGTLSDEEIVAEGRAMKYGGLI